VPPPRSTLPLVRPCRRAARPWPPRCRSRRRFDRRRSGDVKDLSHQAEADNTDGSVVSVSPLAIPRPRLSPDAAVRGTVEWAPSSASGTTSPE
jgi:hypothetical protein